MINNERSDPDSEVEPYVNDLGRNTRVTAVKGTITTKAEYDELDAVGKTWYTYGRIKLTYTWATGETTTYEGFIDSLDLNVQSGFVDVWDYTVTMAIGRSRT